MDNRVIDIRSEGRKAFDLSFQLMFDGAAGGKATHYVDDPKAGLIFLWHDDPQLKSIKLPSPLTWQNAANLAWTWMEDQPDDKRLEWCDHDGSDGKGFRVYNESWGHVAGSHYAFMAVQPIWAWYGK